MNAVNLSDNMDGLAAGLCAIGGIALGITALPTDAGYIASITAGAALGFLVHNFNPARIFMGDAGSLLLGFLLAASALLHTSSGAANLGLAIFAPLAVLALPIFDTALVTTLRRFAGRPLNRGGRDHSSHRLAALGLSDRAAVTVLWVVAALAAGLAIIAESVSGLLFPLAALFVIGLVLFGTLLAEVDVYGEGEGRRRLFGGRFATYARFGAELSLDVVLLTVAYYASHLIRFEGVLENDWMYLFVQTVPVVLGAQIAALVASGVYRTLWRFLSIEDVALILRALTLGSLASGAILMFAYQGLGFSRASLILDWIIASSLIVGARAFFFWLRHWFAIRPQVDERRVLIIGANDIGALAVRLVNRLQDARYRPVGFLDDDPGKRYRRVAGVPVVGRLDDLDAVVMSLKVDLVLNALELPARARAEQLRQACEASGVEWREFVVPAKRAIHSTS
jgi:UDP-GlcNAc:undecaprenyl-phosphate GlcNAc-1-phosphate transferase